MYEKILAVSFSRITQNRLKLGLPLKTTARFCSISERKFIMIKGIIFDMDGVLVDSESAITYASMAVLKSLGVDTEPEEFRPYRGMGDDRFIGAVLENHGGTYKPEYKEKAYRIYLETAHDNVKVYSWSKPIILSLKEKGYRLAVASASDIEKVKCNLDCIGIDLNNFDAIVTGSDIVHNKPAPDIFLKAAEKAGLEPCFCIVAEDSIAGIKAAKAAGMAAVGVTTSFAEEMLVEAGADFVTDDLSVLPEIVSKLSSQSC